MSQLTPSIRLIGFEKWTEDDSYERGCDPDTTHRERDCGVPTHLFPSVAAAMHAVVVPPPRHISQDDIGIISSNIYQDVKGEAQPRTVKDNHAAGLYRATWDRYEYRGRPLSAKVKADWESGKIPTVKLARYEIYFEIIYAGLTEEQVAAMTGCRAW